MIRLQALGVALAVALSGFGGVETARLSMLTTACVNTNIKVRVYGDAAVVVGNVSTSGSFKGVPYKDRQRLFTDTFIRRDGRWQCVASQGTLVGAQQK